MSTGTLADLLDYVGNRVSDSITGVHAVYGAAASSSPDDVKPVPESFDADITCLVWPSGGDLRAGNTETFPVDVDLVFWILKENPGDALKRAIPLIDLCRSVFRTDISAGGNCAWFLVRGPRGGPENIDMNGVTYLVQTVACQGLLMHFSHDYSV